MFGDDWRQIAPAPTPSTPWLTILHPSKWVLGFQVAVRPLYTPLGVSSPTCPYDYITAKLDFSNAFNYLHRDAVLETVNEIIPELYRFCHLTYSQHSTLQFGELSLSSQQGPQQGDPPAGRSALWFVYSANLAFSFVPTQTAS